MKSLRVIVCSVAVFASSAWSQVVNSFSELELILDDQIQIEDFEGISLHSGSTIDLPNPFNWITIQKLPWSWDIEEGITYESPTLLQMRAGFFGGNEEVFLRSHDGVEMRFDAAQVAFGLDLVSFVAGSAYTVNVYDRNDALIEEITHPSDTGTSFFGYQSPTRGISRVEISHPQLDFLSIDNVAFGMDFIACPADMNGDSTQDIFDVFAFVGFFNEEDDRADFTDDGQFDVFDVFEFVDAIDVGCP